MKAPAAQDDPFEAPASRVIRQYAERLLREADVAVTRLTDPDDAEALHDSRVAIRRLRGWLRAYKSWLPVKHRQRRRLGALAHETNLARDVEVCMHWLGTQRATLDTRLQPGIEQLHAALATRRDAAYLHVRRDLLADWTGLSRDLAALLAGKSAQRRGRKPFQKVYAASLRDALEEFAEAFSVAAGQRDHHAIHVLRIAGKRLRYLAEVAAPWHPEFERAVRELKTLQDHAGAIQDLQNLHELLEHEFLAEATARHKRLHTTFADTAIPEQELSRLRVTQPVSPLLWLARAVTNERSALIAGFIGTWLGSEQPPVLAHLRELLAGLRRQRPEEKPEVAARPKPVAKPSAAVRARVLGSRRALAAARRPLRQAPAKGSR